MNFDVMTGSWYGSWSRRCLIYFLAVSRECTAEIESGDGNVVLLMTRFPKYSYNKITPLSHSGYSASLCSLYMVS